MKTHLALYVVIPVLLVAALPVWSQSRQADFVLGTKTIRLGMPKNDVIAMLATIYTVRPAGTEDWWQVSSNPPYTDATPYTPIANLGFESGKLVYISKRRLDADRYMNAPALMRKFHAILTDFLAEQGKACHLSTEHYQLPGNEEHRMGIACGEKLLSVEISSAFDSLTINEIRGYLPNTLQPKAQEKR
jgi:hypothetical protein